MSAPTPARPQLLYTQAALGTDVTRKMIDWMLTYKIPQCCLPQLYRRFGLTRKDVHHNIYVRILKTQPPADIGLATVVCNNTLWYVAGMQRSRCHPARTHPKGRRVSIRRLRTQPSAAPYVGYELCEADHQATLQQLVAATIRTLPVKWREVVAGYYGLDGQPAQSMPQLAKQRKVTRSRIGQVLQTALYRLQRSPRLQHCYALLLDAKGPL